MLGPFWAQIAFWQLIATSITALASISIAFAALRIARMQLHGLPPVLVYATHGMHGGGSLSGHYVATVEFEFWNRRKYPVRIAGAQVRFSQIKVDPYVANFQYKADWIISSRGSAYNRESKTVDPGQSADFKLEAPFQKQSLDNLDDVVTMEIDFFDPVANKKYSIVAVGKYNFK